MLNHSQNPPPLISVIVPAHNEEKYLGSCLDSLLNQDTQIPYEILVIENGSSDKTTDIARSFEKIRLIHEPKLGLPLVRQIGYKTARGDLLAYVDADSIVPPNWVSSIFEASRQNPDAVALRGPFRYILKSPFHRFWFWIYFNVIERATYWLNRGQLLAGGNFAVKKEALDKIGGFNLNIKFYGEDVELASRLKKIGKIVYFNAMVYSSGRRFDHKGLIIPSFIYLFNYLWLFAFKKPCFNFYDQAESNSIYPPKPPAELPEEDGLFLEI